MKNKMWGSLLLSNGVCCVINSWVKAAHTQYITTMENVDQCPKVMVKQLSEVFMLTFYISKTKFLFIDSLTIALRALISKTLQLLWHFKNKCKLSSSLESQIAQFEGQFTPLSRNLICVGRQFLQTRHIKFVTFGGTLSLHIEFHTPSTLKWFISSKSCIYNW